VKSNDFCGLCAINMEITKRWNIQFSPSGSLPKTLAFSHLSGDDL